MANGNNLPANNWEQDRLKLRADQTELRSSLYNIQIMIQSDAAMLLNGATGAIDLVSIPIIEALKSTPVLPTLPIEVLVSLERRGYVTDLSETDERSAFVERSRKHHNEKIANSLNTFWVIPTYRCNLRCYYCFQGHSWHRGEGIFGSTMTPDHVKFLFEAFSKLGGPGASTKKRYITLFGGEPLMDVTLECVQDLVERAQVEGYKIGAVSNGIEAHLFANCFGPTKIRWMQITLDGLTTDNDRRRIPCGGSRFNQIADNISLVLDKGCSVSLRTNIDLELLEKTESLEEFASKRGWTKYEKFFWTVVPIEAHTNRAIEKIAPSPLQIINNLKSKQLTVLQPPYRDGIVNALESLMYDTIWNVGNTSSCGAHTGMYFFDCFGQMFSCAEQVGHADLAVGHYGPTGAHLYEAPEMRWKDRYVGSVYECSKCAYALFCGGGCANAARSAKGSYFSSWCNHFQSSFDSVVIDYAENHWADKLKSVRDHQKKPFAIPLNEIEQRKDYQP